ncbi:carboxypeptidase-like regulatory domain-containing protein [Patescibacteria group bacterium]|nr:carboxypeptidase-like regulatory domain-containing protein [Patescibacteria group bacterium]
MKKIFSILVILTLTGLNLSALAVTTSDSYRIYNGSINPISGEVSSTNYGLDQSGSPLSGSITSDNYSMDQGSASPNPEEEVVLPAGDDDDDDSASSIDSGGVTILPKDQKDPFIKEIKFKAESYKITLEFETNEDTISYIQYGKKPKLNFTTPAEEKYSKSHSVFLENLLPNTDYNLTINLWDKAKNLSESLVYNLKTKPIPTIVPNIANLKAQVYGKTVKLSWENPSINDLSHIVIEKDGEGTIFESLADQYTDLNVEYGKDYNYTLFVVDEDENRSSGAFVKIKIPKLLEEKEATEGEDIPSEDIPGEEPPEDELPPIPLTTTLKEVEIIEGIEQIPTEKDIEEKDQEGQQVEILEDEEKGLIVYEDSNILIAIPATQIKEKPAKIELKINGQSYFLNYDLESDKYYGMIKTPTEEGSFKMIIKNKEQKLEKNIEVKTQGRIYTSKYPVILPFINNFQPAYLAKIHVYQLQKNGSFELWNASQYNQLNPQYSNEEGKYSLILPAGKYFFHITKPGYRSYTSEMINLEAGIFNQDFMLKRSSILDLKISLIFAIIIGFLIVTAKVGNRYRK